MCVCVCVCVRPASQIDLYFGEKIRSCVRVYVLTSLYIFILEGKEKPAEKHTHRF